MICAECDRAYHITCLRIPPFSDGDGLVWSCEFCNREQPVTTWCQHDPARPASVTSPLLAEKSASGTYLNCQSVLTMTDKEVGKQLEDIEMDSIKNMGISSARMGVEPILANNIAICGRHDVGAFFPGMHVGTGRSRDPVYGEIIAAEETLPSVSVALHTSSGSDKTLSSIDSSFSISSCVQSSPPIRAISLG
ncbi:unnamed protein product [Protopolystoma xenopodis]|uniref:PHD-type domain-containing protein n=1 Tax=Protopolystoma xenopodis TaxID=117903 RepID=A0A448XNY8_9PLAT|nr:unnamed protein product [Protopolystoma xenopodis]